MERLRLVLSGRAEKNARAMQDPITAAALNEMTEEQRKALSAGPFALRLHHLAGSFVAPLWWIEPRITSQFIQCVSDVRPRNGSIFFIDISGRLFGVTAAHVYRGYLDAAKQNSRLTCRLGNLEFDLTARLRDLDTTIDIATFDVTYEELGKVGKQAIVTSAHSWPPLHPFSKQGAYLAGFPGTSRIWVDSSTISFGLYCAHTPVGSAGDRQITFPFEREFWVDTVGAGFPPDGMDLGGISGGPVLIPIEENGAWSFSVAGVISEARTTSGYEAVIAVPAHFIAADGSINHEHTTPTRHFVKA